MSLPSGTVLVSLPHSAKGTKQPNPLELALSEEARRPLRKNLVWQMEATKGLSDDDDDHGEGNNEDHVEENDEQRAYQNLMQVSLSKDKKIIYDSKYSAPQDTLDNKSFFPVSKHSTLSQDRTIESGWNKKRLAVVLAPVSRHAPPVKKESNTKEERNDDSRVIASSDESLISLLHSASRHKIERNLPQDNTVGTSSGDEDVPRSYYGSGTEDRKLNVNKERGRVKSLARYRKLADRINALEQENASLKSWINPSWNNQGRPFFQVVHRFEGHDRIFFNPPKWRRDSSLEGIQYTLKGDSLSMGKKEYLERSGKLAFAVFKIYAFEKMDDSGVANSQNSERHSLPIPEVETVLFVSVEMRRAIQNYLSKHPDFEQLFPSFDVAQEISAPYLFWYCTRASYESILQAMPHHQRALVRLFGQWVNDNYETEYAYVDNQIERGVISCQSMKYLIRPGDLLVLHESDRPRAYQATSWVFSLPMPRGHPSKEDVGIFNKSWNVRAWSYGFDGVFYQQSSLLEIELDVTDPHEEVELRSLKVTALEWAFPGVRKTLELRGKMYWACRKKKFISCRGEDNIDSLNNVRVLPDFFV